MLQPGQLTDSFCQETNLTFTYISYVVHTHISATVPPAREAWGVPPPAVSPESSSETSLWYPSEFIL